MPVVKYIHVVYDSNAVPPFRRIRDVVWNLTDFGWKCQSVQIDGGQATAWLVYPESESEVSGGHSFPQ